MHTGLGKHGLGFDFVPIRTAGHPVAPALNLQNGNPVVMMFRPAGPSNGYMKKIIAILGVAVVGLTAVNANAGIRFGINVGVPVPSPVVVAPTPVYVQPPMPAPIVETAPVCPTPGYVWVGGSWGWCDNHWVWTRGHWGPPAHWGHGVHFDHGLRAERHDGYRGGFHGEHGRR